MLSTIGVLFVNHIRCDDVGYIIFTSIMYMAHGSGSVNSTGSASMKNAQILCTALLTSNSLTYSTQQGRIQDFWKGGGPD